MLGPVTPRPLCMHSCCSRAKCNFCEEQSERQDCGRSIPVHRRGRNERLFPNLLPRRHQGRVSTQGRSGLCVQEHSKSPRDLPQGESPFASIKQLLSQISSLHRVKEDGVSITSTLAVAVHRNQFLAFPSNV
jgi:hypothetical protein